MPWPTPRTRRFCLSAFTAPNGHPDTRYHYGYGAQRCLFALFSAIGIFVLGCGVSVYHGVHALFDPPELHFSAIAFAIMGLSLVIEGAVLVAAIREMAREKADWPAQNRHRDAAAEFGERIMNSLAAEVDRIESELIARYPRLRHVALESDYEPPPPLEASEAGG